MKISRILWFIVGILLGLVAICVLFPKQGIKIGNITLEFPTLFQVLGAESEVEDGDTIQALTPEELYAQRMASLQTQKTDEFHQFATTSPQRIYMSDETYLDPFFQSLEKADSQHVRILHLGDSQLECDRISSSLREHYQEEFGGHGVGLVPALQTVATYTLSQSVSPVESVGHYLVYGPAETHASHQRYGIMGQVNKVYAGTTIRLSARDLQKYPHSGLVKRITIMAKGAGGISVRANNESISLTSTNINESFTLLTAQLSEGANSITLTVHGEYEIFGIQLDDEKGVSLDNVPMRGCSGTIFTRIDEKTIQPFFENENVRLLMLQYGGNSVPACSSASSISSYMNVLRKQIKLFKRIAPQASILFIGPADMATRIGGEMKTYPNLPQVVDSLRDMCLHEGIAFWDMYSAMGGKGSIVKWYRAKPQLAGGDFIHFTPKGAQKMADMLYSTLQLYYRFYRLRTGQESETDMQEMHFHDTIAHVEGLSTISVSELPPPNKDSDPEEQELSDIQEGITAKENEKNASPDIHTEDNTNNTIKETPTSTQGINADASSQE